MTNVTPNMTDNLYFAKMTFYWPWMCFNGTERLGTKSGRLHIHKQQCKIRRRHNCRGGSKKLLNWHYFWGNEKSALILFSAIANWIFCISSVWLTRNLKINSFLSKTYSEIWLAIGIKLVPLHFGGIKSNGLHFLITQQKPTDHQAPTCPKM